MRVGNRDLPESIRLHETWASKEFERARQAQQRRMIAFVIIGILAGALLGNLLFLTDVKSVLKRVEQHMELREGIR